MQPGGLIRVSFEAVPIEMKSHAHLRAFLHVRHEGHGGASGVPLRCDLRSLNARAVLS
jgi:hypothetical protein